MGKKSPLFTQLFVFFLVLQLACFLLVSCLLLEEAKQFCVYQVGNLSEVFGIIGKFQVVAIHDDEAALVALNPLFVTVVQTLQVVDADAFLKISSALLDVLHEGWDAALDVDHQVGEFHQTDHQVEEVGVVGEIPVAHHTDVVKVGCEDAGILEDGAVLHNGLFGT